MCCRCWSLGWISNLNFTWPVITYPCSGLSWSMFVKGPLMLFHQLMILNQRQNNSTAKQMSRQIVMPIISLKEIGSDWFWDQSWQQANKPLNSVIENNTWENEDSSGCMKNCQWDKKNIIIVHKSFDCRRFWFWFPFTNLSVIKVSFSCLACLQGCSVFHMISFMCGDQIVLVQLPQYHRC